MAELYGAANQDSGVSSYISAASPAPSTGFGHSLGVSGQSWQTQKLEEGEVLPVCKGRRGPREDGWKKKVTKGEQWGSSFNVCQALGGLWGYHTDSPSLATWRLESSAGEPAF